MGLDDHDEAFIKSMLDVLIQAMQDQNPRLTPGEIYDAIAKELDHRCQNIIGRQSWDGN